MAGNGSRFKQQGYDLPKPLIDVNGHPMIKMVIENINLDGNYIFIVQKEHCEKYNLKKYLKSLVDCDIIISDGLTEGAACSVLLADEFLYENCPLLICDSDSLLDWDSKLLIDKSAKYDGAVVTFESQDSSFSYAKCDGDKVLEIAEKKVISKHAICGRYFWSQCSDFLNYAKWMIQKNYRINNEFYVAPVYNYAIEDGKSILKFEADNFYNLGTPEGLKTYLKLPKG